MTEFNTDMPIFLPVKNPTIRVPISLIQEIKDRCKESGLNWMDYAVESVMAGKAVRYGKRPDNTVSNFTLWVRHDDYDRRGRQDGPPLGRVSIEIVPKLAGFWVMTPKGLGFLGECGLISMVAVDRHMKWEFEKPSIGWRPARNDELKLDGLKIV